MRSSVTSTSLPNGARFDVRGTGSVIAAIRRMTKSHSTMSDNLPNQTTQVTETPAGASLTVTSSDPAVAQNIRGLGFYGMLTGGVHHQLHHLKMAQGQMNH